MEKSGTSAAIVSAVVALLVGGGVGYVVGNNNGDDDMTSTSTSQQSSPETAANESVDSSAASLRVGLNNLLREHVSTNLAVNRAIVDQDSDKITAATAAQTANAVDLAATVGSVFGEEAEAAITEMFVEHLEESNAYAMAVQSGDAAAKEAAQTELNEYLDEIAVFFSGAIESLPKDAVLGLLSEHEVLMNKATQEYNDGNLEASFNTQREAETQASGIADALAGGIEAQFPEMF